MHFDVVVVGMQDKDWPMALRSSSLMFWSWAARTLSLRIAHVCELLIRHLDVMLNGLDGDMCSIFFLGSIRQITVCVLFHETKVVHKEYNLSVIAM